jgi:hypothetical protein
LRAVEVRAPTAEDVADLVRNMRAADIAECLAAGHLDLQANVENAIRVSVWARAFRVDGQMAAIVGVHPLTGLFGDTGVPWMLGTDEVTRNARAFVRLSRPYIAQMLDAFPKLINLVHAPNAQAVAWLQRVGFVLQDPIPYGPAGEPFRIFTLER